MERRKREGVRSGARGLDEGESRERDREFARHVLKASEAARSKQAPPPGLSEEAVRLAAILHFLGVQADEYSKTCAGINDPLFHTSILARRMIQDLLGQRKHSIETFVRGATGLDGRSKIKSEEHYSYGFLIGGIDAVLHLMSVRGVEKLSLSLAISHVFKSDEVKRLWTTEKSIRNAYDRYRSSIIELVTNDRNLILSQTDSISGVVDWIDYGLRASSTPLDPRTALTGRKHRLYYRKETATDYVLEVPSHSPMFEGMQNGSFKLSIAVENSSGQKRLFNARENGEE